LNRLIPLAVTLGVLHIYAQAPARLVSPNGVALDSQGNLYISDIGTHQIYKLTAPGKVAVVAGTGEPGFSGDGGPAAKAQFFAPHDIAFDPQGNLIVADSLNHRIRRIDKSGIVTTIAGTGVSGYTGDGGPAAGAQLNGPQSVTFDREGALLIADTFNNVIRRIDASGTITTIAGSAPGFSGDGGASLAALINLPFDAVAGPDGAVYIADGANSRIRRAGPDGKISTIAGFGQGSGSGGAGYSGDGGPADKARLFSPTALRFDLQGALYISDTGNGKIRVIRDGTITTLNADELNTPQKICIAKDGRIFVADRGNHRVRVIDPKGAVRTVAGADLTKTSSLR
jgi:sugar lactone lactonase YvrE